MIMGAEKLLSVSPLVLNQRGQSLLEFLILFPFMLGLTLILIRVNSLIQMSIVDQQYARAQALFMIQNSPNYPRLDLIKPMEDTKTNQLVVGVADKSKPGVDDDEFDPESPYFPPAPFGMISRNKAKSGGMGPDQDEPATRGYVRVRNTVSICTQSNVVLANNTQKKMEASVLQEGFTPSAFLFCRSPLPEMEPHQ